MSAAARGRDDDTMLLPAAVPGGAPAPVPADASVRVHVETVSGCYPRPELASTSPGRTVFHGTGSAAMMAAVLRRMARQLDPPWWRRRGR